jgi:hypothetical protein
VLHRRVDSGAVAGRQQVEEEATDDGDAEARFRPAALERPALGGGGLGRRLDPVVDDPVA